MFQEKYMTDQQVHEIDYDYDLTRGGVRSECFYIPILIRQASLGLNSS